MKYFWEKIRITGLQSCWEWQAYKSRTGYGSFSVWNKETKTYKCWRAHRLAYTLIRGPIPEGLVLDHLCRNRACCHPFHLEAVTQAENKRRDALDVCKRGHPRTSDNLYGKACKMCYKVYQKDPEYRQRSAESTRRWRIRQKRMAS